MIFSLPHAAVNDALTNLLPLTDLTADFAVGRNLERGLVKKTIMFLYRLLFSCQIILFLIPFHVEASITLSGKYLCIFMNRI